MIMTQHEEQLNLPITPPNILSGSREAMEPLYGQLLQHTFPDSHSAVQFCRHACAEFGFTVKQEASANRNIYVYCSREGLPDSQRKPKSAPQRKRPSKRCDCRWRVVLTENNQGLWEFRKASSPTAYEHNHEMMDPKEMVKTWPMEVNHLIIELARQKMQTHEIRDIVKQRFPHITWNERRFYNRLTEERKRIKQREIIERVQRMLFLTAKMCSLVAANDEWSMNVENELNRLYDNYIHLNRFNPETTPLVDFNIDQITLDLDQFIKLPSNYQSQHRNSFSSSNDDLEDDDYHSSSSMIKMEIDDNNSIHTSSTNNSQSNPIVSNMTSTSTPNNNNNNNATTTTTTHSSKKRKSVLLDDIPTSTNVSSSPPTITTIPAPKGSHTVYIPAYTLFVRSHNTRSSTSDTSTSSTSSLHHRKSFQNDMTSPHSLMDISSPHPQQNLSFNNPSFYSLASPTSPSSSSSVTSSTFPHHPHHHQQQQQHRPSSLSTSPPNSNHPHPSHPMMHPTSSSTTTTTHFQTSSPPSSNDHHPSFYMKPNYQQQPPHHPTSIAHPHSFSNMPLQQAAQIYSMQPFPNYPPNQSSTHPVNTNTTNNTNNNNNNNNNNSNNNNNTNNHISNNNNNNNNNNHHHHHSNDINFSFDQSTLISNPTSPTHPSSPSLHGPQQQQSHQRHPSDIYRSMMDFNINQHHSPSPSSTSSIHHQKSSNDLNNNNNTTNNNNHHNHTNNNNTGLYMYSSSTTNHGSSNHPPPESHYRPSSLPSTSTTSQRLQNNNNNNHSDMMNRIMMDQASMT